MSPRSCLFVPADRPERFGKALLPLIESAAAFEASRELVRVPRVARREFGAIDIPIDLGIEGDDDELLKCRSQLVLVTRPAGLQAPVDGVTTALGDESAVARDTARSRHRGFGAKLWIHRKQGAAVNQGFMPASAVLEWAERVLAAAQSSDGAGVTVEGRMIDVPVMAL